MLAWFLCLPAVMYGQRSDFSGLKIFINPGHGGHDGDDRHMIATDFWESEGNLTKGLFLRELLESRNATVYMSRTTNYTSDDLKLSVIAEMANQANADFFISIHSNGFDGTRNQPLVLFRAMTTLLSTLPPKRWRRFSGRSFMKRATAGPIHFNG